MIRKLKKKEIKDLIAQHRKERDRRICDRLKAVLLLDKGYAYREIAEILLLDDATIRRHVKDFFFENKVFPERGGSASYLTKDQSEKLMAHLDGHTYLYAKEICAYVQKTFGVTYGIRGMTHWLQAHGFRHKKPHGVPAKANKEDQAAFTKAYQLLKNSLKPDEIIYFADSCHPQHQTKLAYGWIKKGIRKPVKMTSCQKRVNIIGAINPENHHVVHQVVDWVNSERIKLFLTHLMSQNKDKKTIHLIWDNAGYHKSKEIKAFIENTNIKLHFLPPYSPNLNPIERLWKVMHERVTYNRYYEKFRDFTEGILGFFSNIKKHHAAIQARITDNFQQLVFP